MKKNNLTKKLNRTTDVVNDTSFIDSSEQAAEESVQALVEDTESLGHTYENDELPANSPQTELPKQVDPQLYVIRLLEGIYVNTQETASALATQLVEKEAKELGVEQKNTDEAISMYAKAAEERDAAQTKIIEIARAVEEAFDADGVDDISIPNKFSIWWVISNANSIFKLLKKIIEVLKRKEHDAMSLTLQQAKNLNN